MIDNLPVISIEIFFNGSEIMDNRKQLGTVKVNVGVNMPALIDYAVQCSIEKAQREALPDLTVADLQAERTHGVHQGVWEVVAKLLDQNPDCAAAVVSALNPRMKYIHEFDWENLVEYFGDLRKSKAWIKGLTSDAPSLLDALGVSGADISVVGKKGDRIEGDTNRQGRDFGIAEALLEAYLLDRQSSYEVMCLDLYVPADKVHPLTMARATCKPGGIDAFKSFLS